MSARVLVPAKINLALCVGPRRADGFHNLATVFHAVDLVDEVIASARDDAAIEVSMSGRDVDQIVGDNLAVRAAARLREAAGRPDLGVNVSIRKAIPVAGGMAGGSADAAGALLACNAEWGLGADEHTLHDLAAELGSDVPFSLVGGNALGRGRGERLEAVAQATPLDWVIAISTRQLSTPRVFARFDEMVAAGELTADDTDPVDLMSALAAGDLSQVAGFVRNDLQPPAISLVPELADVLAAGERAGALAALVSGSGPTCVFLVSPETADLVADALVALPVVSDVVRAHGPIPTGEVTQGATR